MDQKTIGILTFKAAGIQPWNPDSLKHGLHGAEETVIFMSQKLANMGYRVLVYVDWIEQSPYANETANPRFVGVNVTDWQPLDIAISWRVPYGASWLKAHVRQVYFWPHDRCSYLLTEEDTKGFDNVLWVSQWQREEWIKKNPFFEKFADVFGNGINPEQFHPLQKRNNPYSCIYGSNYAQGLEILLDIWPLIKEKYPKATLDIYYGWNHFGLLSPETEHKMRNQVKTLAPLDVKEHGQVGLEELNQAYERSSLWTYPCMGFETFCITALRSQFSGTIPVVIEGSALKETVRHGFKCNKKEEYCNLLMQAMAKVDKITLSERDKMKDFILKEFTWDIIANKWHTQFEKDRKNQESL
jgi:glycosyltransferase involved in cell wall biosynthesis